MTNLQFINILREVLGKEPISNNGAEKKAANRVTLSLVCDCGQEFRTQASRRSHSVYMARFGRKCG